MNQLGMTVEFYGDETVPSFCSRLAAANGDSSMRAFCSNVGLNVQKIISGSTSEIERLMLLAGLEPRVAERGYPQRFDSLANAKGEVILARSYSTARLRYCPRCLLEDIEHGSGPKPTRPYGRKIWCLSFIRACRKHEVGLQTINKRDFLPAIQHDVVRMIDKVRKDLDADLPKQAYTPFERYLEDRITGGNRATLWIDEFPLYMVARLCETLGAMELFDKMFLSEHRSEADWADASQVGFDVLSKGPKSFEAHLRTCLEPFWKSRSHVGGGVIYGRLYQYLDREIDDEVYDPIRKIMHDVAVETLPFGEGDYLFGSIKKRQIHSVHSAALEYRMHWKTMHKLAKSAGIIIPGSGSTPERTLMKAGELRKLMEDVGDGVDWETARDRLGISVAMWKSLAKHHIRPLAVTNRPNIHSLYEPAEIARFIEMAISKSTVPLGSSEGLLPISMIVRKANCKFSDVIDLLLEGRLTRVAFVDQGVGLGRLLYDLEEIAELVRLPDHGHLSLHAVSKRMKIGDGVIRRLVDLNYLPSELVINPVKRRKQQVVSEEAIARFEQEFVSLHLLSRSLNRIARLVKSELTSLGVEPAFPRGEVGATFYRRQNLPKLKSL